MYLYRLVRIWDSDQWPKGCSIWAYGPCKGWRTVKKIKID